MRIPLAVNLESRDGARDPRDETVSLGRDARIINGFVEVKGERAFVRKRPGLVSIGAIRSGTGQLLWNWNGVRTVVDDYIHSGTIATIISSPSATNLSPTNADLQMSAANTGSGAATPRMMFKNRSQAWVMNRAGTVSGVTYGGTMGSQTFAVVSLTRSGTTATGTVASDVPFDVGESVTVAGANETDYNGTFALTAVTPGVYRPERVIPITITRSGTTATAASTDPHGLSTGTYTIAGANDSAYNGSKSITVTSEYAFTYTVTVTPAATTTLNPSDKNSNITLSGGNLVATSTSTASAFYGVRGTIGKSTGKWYWEVTVTSQALPIASGGQIDIGIAKATASLAVGANFAGDVWAYDSAGSKINSSGSYFGLSTYDDGDVIGVAVDLDGGAISFYKNGVLQGGFDNGVSGTVYPYISLYDGSVVTANFGGSAFAQTIPSGFTALNSDSPYSPASGSITVTDPAVATPATFSYTVSGSPTTPATGTLTVQGSGGTVPGIVYLNGYFFVMDTSGRIWNSASEDPTTWGALDYVDAQNDSSRATGLASSRGYVVAFKEWSTEFFYDAGNATGSPLSPVDSGTIQIGCATGWSIASIDDSTFWMSQTSKKGRGVHVLTGLETRKVSTPDVDRILDDCDISIVYAFCLKVDGHTLYVLTIATDLSNVTSDEGITLVYDSATDIWYEWTTYPTAADTLNPSAITRSGDVATATVTTTALRDGMWVKMAGAAQSEYNGVKQIFNVTGSALSYKVAGEPLTPATTASSFSLTFGDPARWHFVGAINFGDDVLLLGENGALYALSDEVFVDDGFGYTNHGIDFVIRTPRFDGGTLRRKSLARLFVIGYTVSDIAMIRWSDDDYRTATGYRPVDLSADDPELRRCGAFKRRSFELKHTGNSNPIFEALEIDLGQ